ncbi:MAG: phenylacetate-CoA oxygenase/reductase subunit PaaK [Saprospirales bacterium]|nr:MAG: phenylacetate-CoA oxygenase/reductase subunit PaaK [Saprospirales bacterium]
MAKKFYPLRVSKIERLTEESVAVELEVDGDLREAFRFVPGQYLTFKREIEGEEVRRNYSICAAQGEGVLRVGIKELKGGKFSTFANRELKEGDALDTLPPEGNFTHKPDARKKGNYTAFACGSGITPVLSILKSVLKQESESNFTLFYGNRGVSSIMFKEELEGLKNLYLDRFSLYHILSRERGDIPLFEGRINREKVDKFASVFFDPKKSDTIFLCGPGQMILDLKEHFAEMGIPKSKVHFELFTTEGFEAPKSSPPPEPDEIAGDLVKVKMRIDGDIHEYDMPKKGETLLDAASRTVSDVPYACKGGVCSTCRAKLVEGKVHMESNYALEEDEVNQGFILTCQSYPLTEEIAVDFDIR